MRGACTYPHCARMYGGCGLVGCTQTVRWRGRSYVSLSDALMASTVSATGRVITIHCDDHDSKDAILNFLTGDAIAKTEVKS